MRIDKHIFRQSDFIDVAVHDVLDALRDGGVLVAAIVFLFLRPSTSDGGGRRQTREVRDEGTPRLDGVLQSLGEVMEAWAKLSPFMPRDKA